MFQRFCDADTVFSLLLGTPVLGFMKDSQQP